MAQHFGIREAAVGGGEHALEHAVAGLVHVDFPAKDAAHVHVDMLLHSANGARVAADLDDRQDGIADDVALAGGEEVHDEARRGYQRHHFGGGGGGIHVPQTRSGGRFGLVEHAVHHALLSDFLDVAEGLLLDGGEPADNVALGGLRIGKIAGLVAVDVDD